MNIILSRLRNIRSPPEIMWRCPYLASVAFRPSWYQFVFKSNACGPCLPIGSLLKPRALLAAMANIQSTRCRIHREWVDAKTSWRSHCFLHKRLRMEDGVYQGMSTWWWIKGRILEESRLVGQLVNPYQDESIAVYYFWSCRWHISSKCEGFFKTCQRMVQLICWKGAAGFVLQKPSVAFMLKRQFGLRI